MSRVLQVPARIVLGGLAVGSLALPAGALARLPHPKTTLIVPGVSIGGVKIDMTQAQVFHEWGSTGCIPGLCTWQGPGNPAHAERATVSFFKGKVIQIDINAGTTNGTNVKFKPGTLSKWKTAKNIHLGSTRASVKRAYPAAKANNSTGVAGWDLFDGIHLTRFSSFGVGATPDRLRYIELACSVSGQC
ncbi:MAG TPA: hypothetical protein VMU39_29375 [Solirubrobacteraceae bacterium]|nr:hypothetical protein [Solirubrobacteraceae bacterium]